MPLPVKRVYDNLNGKYLSSTTEYESQGMKIGRFYFKYQIEK